MWTLVVLGVALLVAWNVVVTARLWRSPMYARSQQVAQTLLVWLIPGSALLVNWLARGMPAPKDALDPTANDGCTDYGMQGVDAHHLGPF